MPIDSPQPFITARILVSHPAQVRRRRQRPLLAGPGGERVEVTYRVDCIGAVADVIHRARHPYTVGLMGSIPSIVDCRERLTQIDGTMPRLTAIPTGCAFHPRCPYAWDDCSRVLPPFAPLGEGHDAACLRHGAVTV